MAWLIVAFVIDSIHGPMADGSSWLDSPAPILGTMFTFTAIVTLVVTTLINAYGVRLLSILNNIGVATEILPGCALAAAITSATDLNGASACAAKTIGASLTIATGARSRSTS